MAFNGFFRSLAIVVCMPFCAIHVLKINVVIQFSVSVNCVSDSGCY